MKFKKYWYLYTLGIITLIFFPYILNKLILVDKYWEIVGDPKDWLLFWPSYLSALASAVMIGYTAMTLKNNKDQLNELKHQWEEEHKPNVSVSFNLIGSVGYLRIVNTSVAEVKDLSIEAEFYQNGEKMEGTTFSVLRTLRINIEPKGVRNVVLNNRISELPNNEFFILRLNYNGETKEPIKVFCNQVYSIGDDIIWREMIDEFRKMRN